MLAYGQKESCAFFTIDFKHMDGINDDAAQRPALGRVWWQDDLSESALRHFSARR